MYFWGMRTEKESTTINNDTSNLKEKTAKGMFWGGMNNLVQQAIGMVFGIILGRLLSPDDYGLLAMIMVVALIATALQNSGFTVGIINIKSPTHKDFNSVFWFNILMATGLYVILFALAPLIADYYDEPRLTSLCRYSFLSIILSGIGTAQAAYLTKSMQVKSMAKTGMAAVILSSVTGVTMAYIGFGYWSLATQSLVFIGVNSLLLWHYSDWRPTFSFDFSPIRRMFRFSVKILATNIINHANNNILNILLGKYFSTAATGYYNQAYQWNSKLFSLVQGMVLQVVQPMLVSLRDEPSRQLNALRKMVRFTAFITCPLLLGFGMVAHEFITITITAKWLPAADLIQILCYGGAVLPLHTILSYSVISKGRSDINFWCTISLGLAELLIMVMIWPWGIKTMVVAYTLINILWLFVWHFFVRRLTGYRLWHLIIDVAPFAIISFVVMTICSVATASITNQPLLLTVRILMSASLYFIIMKILHVGILNECIAFVKSKFKRQ